MDPSRAPVGRFFDGWQIYNERIAEVVRAMNDEQLAIRPAPERWPIWATVAHTAGARVYWLCGVFGEPRPAGATFVDVATGYGWEDDPATPRSARELVEALDTSWSVVAGCLARWTPDVLFEGFERQRDEKTQVHTRQGVLIRLLSHDAYHCGELSQTLGIHGLEQIDLWRAD